MYIAGEVVAVVGDGGSGEDLDGDGLDLWCSHERRNRRGRYRLSV
jgi:hypothetical protein